MTIVLNYPELLRTSNLVRGQWTEASDCQRFDVLDPATNRVLGSVPDSTSVDAGRAVDAAHAAFGSWRALSGRERSRLLKVWHGLILEHRRDLALIISAEQGKPLGESLGEVAYGAAYVEWFAEEAARITGDILASPSAGRK